MGNTPPPPAPKTAKELTREMNRAIDRMIREFGRDKFRLDFDIKKAKRELENAIKKKESRATQRILAQNIIKNQAFLQKYDVLEAKMKGMKMQIAQVSTTEAMVSVMKNMGDIIGKTTDGLNVNNIQAVIENFNVKMEEHANMAELIDDAMADDGTEIEDADVDKYIDKVTDDLGGKGPGGQKVKVEEAPQSEKFDDMINDLRR